MKTILRSLLVATLVAGTLQAGNITKQEALKIVTPFYQFLSGKVSAKEVQPSFDKDWKSYYGNGEKDYRTFKQTTGFLGNVFRKMVPNLKWDIIDTKMSGNTIIVRGEGSGTVAGPVFITSPVKKGKSFKIMSIDMHTIKNGKVVKTYHIEDYRTAFKQLGIVKPFKKAKK
ncbi:ester cyclase [Sulfurospirillum arcachonense]|uniref:ester cyclase n=1 Tax=Sulfurospirillum arcachonense TaxID=57666 RepID=UPI000468BE5C|nr:ester cyclase [Sulfurospirillum arcachonense]